MDQQLIKASENFRRTDMHSTVLSNAADNVNTISSDAATHTHTHQTLLVSTTVRTRW